MKTPKVINQIEENQGCDYPKIPNNFCQNIDCLCYQ